MEPEFGTPMHEADKRGLSSPPIVPPKGIPEALLKTPCPSRNFRSSFVDEAD